MSREGEASPESAEVPPICTPCPSGLAGGGPLEPAGQDRAGRWVKVFPAPSPLGFGSPGSAPHPGQPFLSSGAHSSPRPPGTGLPTAPDSYRPQRTLGSLRLPPLVKSPLRKPPDVQCAMPALPSRALTRCASVKRK